MAEQVSIHLTADLDVIKDVGKLLGWAAPTLPLESVVASLLQLTVNGEYYAAAELEAAEGITMTLAVGPMLEPEDTVVAARFDGDGLTMLLDESAAESVAETVGPAISGGLDGG